MALYEDIKKIEAEAELIEAQVMELVVEFCHRGGTAVCLAALYVKEGNGVVNDGGRERENRILDCRIPTGQTAFAASTDDTEPIIPGDTLTFNGKVFSVNRDGISRVGDVYQIRASEKKRLSSGVGSQR